MTTITCVAGPAPAPSPARVNASAPAPRSDSLGSQLAGIANASLQRGAQVLDLCAPGRVLRAAPRLLTLLGTLLASAGTAQSRALQPGDAARGAAASRAFNERILPDLDRCMRTAAAATLPDDRLAVYCMARAATRICQRSDDAHCGTTLRRSAESSPPDVDLLLTSADIAAADGAILQHFRQSHGYASAMRTLQAELSLMTDVSEGRDAGEVSELRLREQMQASDGWAAFMQKACDTSPTPNKAYRAAVNHVYRLQPQWLDAPGRTAMQALADERYPGRSDAPLNDDQIRHLIGELARDLNQRARAAAL